MFERVEARAAAAARSRADARADELAEALADAVPRGVAVRRAQQWVEIEGRGIARRFALDPGLRWIVGRFK